MSHDIFISYSRRDIDRMIEIRDILRSYGLLVWTDKGIEPGTISWKQAISKAIRDCHCVVVLFSPDSAQSTWVNRELDYAELHKKRIYPILVRGTLEDAIPFGYTTYQFIDAREQAQLIAQLEEFIATLKTTLEMLRKLSTSTHEHTTSEDTHEDHPTHHHHEQSGDMTWKWMETSSICLATPTSWKISEPTEENWRRAQLLLVGDEKHLYRWVHDESQLMHYLTGIPGLHMRVYRVFTDISGLTPLVGFAAWQNIPVPIPQGIIPLGTRFFIKRFKNFMRDRYESKLTGLYWLTSNQIRILTLELEAKREDNVMKGRAYTIFPPFSKHPLSIFVGCDATRFDEEAAQYDRLVRSVQFVSPP